MFLLFNVFRVISFLEGLSYVLLLFIATPIKYLANDPQYVKILGMPHGLLFMLYIILAFMLKQENKWFKDNFKKVMLASIIPFGTFYLDHKHLSKIDN
ncbi:MAG: integral membrane protein [Glaciecola sp.]|jgi:integral membrane protein